ncbi:MAG: retropepsin-like aspartic protease, partial [Gammaproteobacteria bacterium]
MVDTGATFIAMNAPQAKRLGIQYRMDGQPVMTNTASGTAMGYQVTLQRVRVGEIELRDIDAIVLEGNSPTEVLLGMSFLGRLEMQHSGQVMQLKRKN